MAIDPEKNTSTRSSAVAAFNERIRNKTARVGIVGLGYVGLPIALLFSAKGIEATGFDIDPLKVATLRQGRSYIKHIPEADIAGALAHRRFDATTDFSLLREVDAIIICVPTPLDDHREPDLTYIRSTAESIAANLRPSQLVVLESTTYPGTTEEVVLPILEKSGLRCPIAPYTVENSEAVGNTPFEPDFFLAFSPEREDPGNPNFRTHQIPKVVGGVNAPSAMATQALYQAAFDKTVLVSSSRAAEMTKLLENIYRSVNIALVNELKLLCQRMGLDIWEIIGAAKTKPFGFSAFYPGPGLGGHCIPIDPFYLTWKAREYEFPTRFIELAGEINTSMPHHVVERLAGALNERNKCLHGSRILVLGVSYKKDIDDLRESPSLRIIKLIQDGGAVVDYNDPYFERLHKMRQYDFGLESVPLTEESLARYDAVVIATDHSSYDYEFIGRHAQLIIDTRNAMGRLNQYREKIVQA
ncbi:MAG TPA: nucleotide sugar dehydrogenase [Terriglobia bacterium]|jgi:UDP-N-acetyl-D-glucosamine dehydrogenase|nr:nucleotide sugar dehydrogenase [Terriglobia bacterium]